MLHKLLFYWDMVWIFLCSAVYCIIGHCDARDDHPDVANSTDDYLWLKLGQVTFDDSDSSRERLSLVQLQTMLLEEFGLYSFGNN